MCDCPAHQFKNRECTCTCDHSLTDKLSVTERARLVWDRHNKAILIAGTVVVGAGCAYFGYRAGSVTEKNVLAEQKNFICWKPRQQVLKVEVAIEELSTPSKPIIDQVTKTVYNSISDAVRKTGRTRTSIMKDPNFQLLEEAAV